MDGLNHFRTVRVAEVLSDFRNMQYSIAAAPVDPAHADDYYTEGWSTLRQCSLDGQRVLECGADTRVPEASGGPAEQDKAELKQLLLDAYARRHEAQKICYRQAAAQRWVQYREHILNGARPSARDQAQLRSCDEQLQAELQSVTDQFIYSEMQMADESMGRWTSEDPSLRAVQRWVRTRP